MNERPVIFFGGIGVAFILAALVMFIPILQTYIATGLVPRIPTMIVIAGLGIASIVSWMVAVIVQGITDTRREAKQLAFLAHS
jgi:hypothetical protein